MMMSHIESQVGETAAGEVETLHTADWRDREEAGAGNSKAKNCSAMVGLRNAHLGVERRTRKNYPEWKKDTVGSKFGHNMEQ